jgi:tripartite-type tricarboxylate transporter receptor subunit TctC
MLVGPCMQSLLAQDYPQKTIRLIVSYPPGGTADMLARTINQKMAESLG